MIIQLKYLDMSEELKNRVVGKVNQMDNKKHLKDRELMNNKIQEAAGLKELKQICSIGYKPDGTKDVEILSRELRVHKHSGKQTNPKHEKCAAYYKVCKTEKREKSICRCMFYYNPNSKKCNESCKFKRKWNYIGSDMKIIDYETPMENKILGIGNIDLRIKYKDCEYGVEVKPPENNEETICRMISEAMTYTIDFPSCKPAIAVFGPSVDGKYRGSYQYKSLHKLKDNNDFKFIIRDYVKVFIITILCNINDTVVDYTIVPYN